MADAIANMARKRPTYFVNVDHHIAHMYEEELLTVQNSYLLQPKYAKDCRYPTLRRRRWWKGLPNACRRMYWRSHMSKQRPSSRQWRRPRGTS
eukprot:TRINITY_DN45411_c0_g1_i1.p1 TRINITY_DN45411_c0_g1~~TRINITY_DN45411_c0_g1_i1.p1  ORF type:complete len:106 (-),score=16.63 TRINITY_DN45411_c0_g1_i1:89-367(-)